MADQEGAAAESGTGPEGQATTESAADQLNGDSVAVPVADAQPAVDAQGHVEGLPSGEEVGVQGGESSSQADAPEDPQQKVAGGTSTSATGDVVTSGTAQEQNQSNTAAQGQQHSYSAEQKSEQASDAGQGGTPQSLDTGQQPLGQEQTVPTQQDGIQRTTSGLQSQEQRSSIGRTDSGQQRTSSGQYLDRKPSVKRKSSLNQSSSGPGQLSKMQSKTGVQWEQQPTGIDITTQDLQQLQIDPAQQDISAQLELQQKAHQEVEDMLLRLEYHYQAEITKREAAEVAAAEAQAAADAARAELASTQTAQSSRAAAVAAEEQQLTTERQSLDKMRTELETELQQARAEVAKAQEALGSAEEKVRQDERQERMRLEVAHRGQIERLEGAIAELQGQLHRRTAQLTQEMLRWKHQAEMAANAVIDAKNEVLARKRELDTTKIKMDELIDKLYTGRELGIDLGGQIAGAMAFYQTLGMGPIGHTGPPMPVGLLRPTATGRPAIAQPQMARTGARPPGMPPPPFPPLPGAGAALTMYGVPGGAPDLVPANSTKSPVEPSSQGVSPQRSQSQSPGRTRGRAVSQPKQPSRTLQKAQGEQKSPDVRNDVYQHVQSRHMVKAGTYVAARGEQARQLRQSTQRKGKPARELNEREQHMIAHTARWV